MSEVSLRTECQISTFNIAGRYADEKFEFYKRYNKRESAQKYLKITQSLFLWLKEELQKKQAKSSNDMFRDYLRKMLFL